MKTVLPLLSLAVLTAGYRMRNWVAVRESRPRIVERMGRYGEASTPSEPGATMVEARSA